MASPQSMQTANGVRDWHLTHTDEFGLIKLPHSWQGTRTDLLMGVPLDVSRLVRRSGRTPNANTGSGKNLESRLRP